MVGVEHQVFFYQEVSAILDKPKYKHLFDNQITSKDELEEAQKSKAKAERHGWNLILSSLIASQPLEKIWNQSFEYSIWELSIKIL